MTNLPPNHPIEQLRKKGEEIRKRQEKEVVYCPECETEVLKDDIEEAVRTAEKHDESRHGGEKTAKVNGINPPEFTEEEKQAVQDAVEALKADEG